MKRIRPGVMYRMQKYQKGKRYLREGEEQNSALAISFGNLFRAKNTIKIPPRGRIQADIDVSSRVRKFSPYIQSLRT